MRHGERAPEGEDEGAGDGTDERFLLANERTLLAWIRTALALVAGGFAVAQLLPGASGLVLVLLALSLIALGGFVAAAGYRRYLLVQQALRANRSLPATRLPLVLAVGIVLVALLAGVVTVQALR